MSTSPVVAENMIPLTHSNTSVHSINNSNDNSSEGSNQEALNMVENSEAVDPNFNIKNT